jgi:hypothetical protein
VEQVETVNITEAEAAVEVSLGYSMQPIITWFQLVVVVVQPAMKAVHKMEMVEMEELLPEHKALVDLEARQVLMLYLQLVV